jgi:hypothetical protein
VSIDQAKKLKRLEKETGGLKRAIAELTVVASQGPLGPFGVETL